MKNEVAVVMVSARGWARRWSSVSLKKDLLRSRSPGGSSLTSLRAGDDAVILYDCDATMPEQVERLFQKIQSDYGPLCITVFNACAFERREVVETDPADFDGSAALPGSW